MKKNENAANENDSVLRGDGAAAVSSGPSGFEYSRMNNLLVNSCKCVALCACLV